MASRGRPVPKKLKDDAIIEAIFEIRFATATIPEILYGRLADYAPWHGFAQRRLPAYEIPAPIREADPNLRFQAVFELVGDHRIARIGPQVISYHRAAPYIGWQRFLPELREAIVGLFERTDRLVIQRLGLRYLNALRSDVHCIGSVFDLDLNIEAAGERLAGNVNLNFTVDPGTSTGCTVRIATTEFVQGMLPQKTSVYVDVDVFTQEGFETKDYKTVEHWVSAAHTKEKEQFFRLLTDKSIDALEEK